MEIYKCEACGGTVDTKTNKCEYCGSTFMPKNPKPTQASEVQQNPTYTPNSSLDAGSVQTPKKRSIWYDLFGWLFIWNWFGNSNNRHYTSHTKSSNITRRTETPRVTPISRPSSVRPATPRTINPPTRPRVDAPRPMSGASRPSSGASRPSAPRPMGGGSRPGGMSRGGRR